MPKGEVVDESVKFGLIEKAVYMKMEGHTPAAIMKSLSLTKSTYGRWHASDDWKDIERDVRQAQKDEMRVLWRCRMHEAVTMVKRIAKEGNPDGQVFLDAMKFIVESQDLGPKGETSDKEISSGPSPVAIQIIQGSEESLQLRNELRNRLGGPDDGLDVSEE